MKAPPDGSLERWRDVLRSILFVVLLVSPLPFGSVQPGAVLSLQLTAALAGGMAIRIAGRDARGLSPRAGHLLFLTGALVTVGLLQLLPVPRTWLGVVAPSNARARELVEAIVPEILAGAVPQSLEPAATLDAVLRLSSFILLGLAAAVAVRSIAHLRQTALVLAVSGAFQALYGSAEYLTGHQHIFAYAKRAFSSEASGTFINRNHFAAYLVMVLPLALGLVYDAWLRRRERVSWRARILALAEPPGLIAIGGAVATALMWIGVILSYSRAGLAAALLVTGGVALAVRGRVRLGLLACLLLLPTAWLQWKEVRPPAERFFSHGDQVVTVGGRLPVWQASLGMIPDRPILGTGIGTFESAFLLYRPPMVRKIWDHAHNDWLQLAVEGGVAAVGLMILALLVALRTGTTPRESARNGTILSFCVAVSIVGTALLSLVDFSLRIPAIAVLLAVLVGAGAGSAAAGGNVLVAPLASSARMADAGDTDTAP